MKDRRPQRRTRSLLGAPFIFTRIADTSTTIPGDSIDFTRFGQPSLDDGNVSFFATAEELDGTALQKGIYEDNDGTLGVVADLDTPVAMGGGEFFAFNSILSSEQSNLAILAAGNTGEGDYLCCHQDCGHEHDDSR